MSPPKYKSSIYIEPVDATISSRIVNNYLCSTCWGNLQAYPQPQEVSHIHLDIVLCIKCGEDTRGYVHKSTVDQKKQEDHFNAQEVGRAYPALVKNPREKKGAEQNINELGL